MEKKNTMNGLTREQETFITEYQKKVEQFQTLFDEAKKQYFQDGDLDSYQQVLKALAVEHSHIERLSDFYSQCAEEFSACGDLDAEFTVYQVMEKYCKYYDELTLKLKVAHYYFEKGNDRKGKKCLDNLTFYLPKDYEDAFERRELTEIWNKYRHYLDGKIPPSVSNNRCSDGSKKTFLRKQIAKCSKTIDEIFALPEDKLLLELSEHLYELSDRGEDASLLNKWERIFFDVDNLLTDIGSDGIPHFLTSNGHRFEQTKKALQTVGAEKALQLMDMIAAYFPKGKVPKSDEKREDIVNDIMDEEESFDAAEEFYFEQNVECELVDAEYQFALANKKKFRQQNLTEDIAAKKYI